MTRNEIKELLIEHGVGEVSGALLDALSAPPAAPASDIVERLEPCPFCNWPATAMEDRATRLWRVYCNDDGTCGDDAPGCCAEGPERDTETEAIAAWNTRATIEANRAEIARLRHVASDLLQHVDWLTCGLPEMLEKSALTDEEGLIGAAVDAANSARRVLTGEQP